MNNTAIVEFDALIGTKSHLTVPHEVSDKSAVLEARVSRSWKFKPG